MPPLPLIARNMLDGGASRFAGELRQACLVDELAAGRLDADPAHMLQAFDQAQHRSWLGGLGHLPQPRQPALARLRRAPCQGIEALALLGGQAVGQPTMHLLACVVPQLAAQPLQPRDRGHDDVALPAHLHCQAGEEGQPVVLDRLRQQGAHQFRRRAPAEGLHPKLVLALDRLTLPGPLRGQVVADRAWEDFDLLGDEPEQCCRRAFAGAQRAAREPQVAEHQRMAEAVVVAAAAPDRGQVRSGQRVVAHQLALLGRRVEQVRNLGFGQLLPSRHRCLLGLDPSRPSDPGRESISVLRLMPKVRQAEADSRAGVCRHAIMDGRVYGP